MKNLFVLAMTYLFFSKSFAQFNTVNTKYIFVDLSHGFNQTDWNRGEQNSFPTITAYNYSFVHSYDTAIKTTVTKKYLITLFILPSKQFPTSTWKVDTSSYTLENIINKSGLEILVRESIDEAKQYPARTAIVYNIKPILKVNGKYFITKNFTLAQCWEVIEKQMTNPDEATASTINTEAKVFSKKEIEERKQQELNKLKIESNSPRPLGGQNIFANNVYLNEKDSINNIYRFSYNPAEVFDGSYLDNGIEDFMYCPCIGIIGGNFRSYFRSHQIDPMTSEIGMIRYAGYYKAYQVNNKPIEVFLKRCR